MSRAQATRIIKEVASEFLKRYPAGGKSVEILKGKDITILNEVYCAFHGFNLSTIIFMGCTFSKLPHVNYDVHLGYLF